MRTLSATHAHLSHRADKATDIFIWCLGNRSEKGHNVTKGFWRELMKTARAPI